MVAEELFIEGQRVELYPGSVSRNLQINNLGEVKDYMSNYSNTIKLPRTPLNVSILDYLGVNGNRSESPYRQLHARYIVNGIPLVVNGYAVVKATTDSFEVIIYDGIKDLAERVKGKTLRDLNYSDLNHYLTFQTYSDSLENTEGYIYALGEFIPRPYFSSIRIDEQAPSLFVKTIWDKIFAEAGLNYSGSFFTENEDFQTEAITPGKGYPVENIELDSVLMGNIETNNISRQAQSTDPLLSFRDTHTFENGGFTGITVGIDGSLTFQESGQIQIDITTNYTNFDSWVNLRVTRGGVVSFIQLPEGGNVVNTTINLSVTAGDVMMFELSGTPSIDQGQGDPGTIEGVYSVNYSARSTIVIHSQTGGQFIDFAEFVPEMLQLDFIKDVMRRYGLLFKSVNNYEGYQFTQFEKLLNNRDNAQDWSDRLSHIEKEEYDIEYGKNNIASYNYPEEIVDHNYNGIMKIDNDNAPDTQELFQAPYTIPTRRARQWKNQWIYQSHIWEEKEEEGETVIADVETPAKVFRIQRVDTSINTIFFDDSSSNVIEGSIPFLSLHNMELQYYLGRYYKAFQNLISRAKKVTAIMNLTELDIYQLDFFKLKYLSQTGRFYYLNTVRHIPGRVNRVELIEIPSFVKNLPPTTLGVYALTLNYEQVRGITVEQLTEHTDPIYFDPEFDEPAAIQFTSGFSNPNVTLKNGDDIITSDTIVTVDDWNIRIEDEGNTTAGHNANFTFKIMDKGSGQWSEVEGTIEVTVNPFDNQSPVAGPYQNVVIDESLEFPVLMSLIGSGSYDNTGDIVSYQWSLEEYPLGADVLITNPTSMNAGIPIPQDNASIGTYIVKLTVTDEFGLSDSDTATIEVVPDLGGGLEPE